MGVSKILLNGVTQIDLTSDTVASANLLSGYTATGADGDAVAGGVSSLGATTYTPTTTSQTIAAGQYLSGVQTIAAIPSQYKDTTGTDATAAYIAKGKKAVTGSGLITGTAELVYTAATESLTLPSWVVTLA